MLAPVIALAPAMAFAPAAFTPATASAPEVDLELALAPVTSCHPSALPLTRVRKPERSIPLSPAYDLQQLSVVHSM